ncbi:MAG: sigma-70 family RNA polymerase sigma factor [Anaerolineae bacterium]
MANDVLLTLDEIFKIEHDDGAEDGAPNALSDFHTFFENNLADRNSDYEDQDGEGMDASAADLSAIPTEASLSLYFRQMSQAPLLDKEDEVRLAKRVERGRKAQQDLAESDHTLEEIERLESQVRDGQTARKELAEANTRLVVSVAKKYRGFGLPFMDLIQAGNVGLLRAIDKFDYRRGYKLSTYATWWIRQAVTRSLSSNKRTIRIPVHKDSWIRRVSKVSTRLQQKMGRRPTYEEIAEEMGEEPAKLRKILRLTQLSISLNKPVGNDGEDDGSELGSFLEDTTIPSPTKTVELDMLQEELENMLGTLRPREAWVLRMRFGLHGNRTHTFKELGKKLGLSKERVRQIQAKALRKLRHPTFRRHLEDFR